MKMRKFIRLRILWVGPLLVFSVLLASSVIPYGLSFESGDSDALSLGRDDWSQLWKETTSLDRYKLLKGALFREGYVGSKSGVSDIEKYIISDSDRADIIDLLGDPDLSYERAVFYRIGWYDRPSFFDVIFGPLIWLPHVPYDDLMIIFDVETGLVSEAYITR